MTNTLVNYSKTNRSISWQWYAEKVSRNAAGEQGFVPRLERYGLAIVFVTEPLYYRVSQDNCARCVAAAEEL